MIRGFARAALLLLVMTVGGVHARAIYKCVDASGAPAFQGRPCAAGATQTSVQVRGQPLIDAGAATPLHTPSAPARHAPRHEPRGRDRAKGRSHHSHASPPTSWECRAADGEVFYRHSRCPHSVPGDGVMRSGGTYALHRGSGARSRARSAWDPVPVHARKVSRSEACRQINAVAAVERDGSARDERVSVYAHDLGRDPCSGY